ncbi:MAG: hypothetical protein V4660_06145 [Pseudomonadota bacterium]
MTEPHQNYRAICVKLHPLSKEEMGLVKLLFIYNEEHEHWETPNKNIFIQENIWIRANYSAIDHKFEEGKVFELSSINKTAFEKQDSTRPEDYCDWCANGKESRSLSESELVPIFDLPLPDINTGIINSQQEIPYLRILIRNEGFVYGPFNISENENGQFIASPYEMALNLDADHIVKIDEKILFSSGAFLNFSLVFQNIPGFIESLLLMKNLCRDHWEKVDYINSSKLIKWVSNTKRKGERQKVIASKKVIDSLLADLRDVKLSDKKDLSLTRYSRAISLLEQEDAEIDFVLQFAEQLVNDAVNTPLGKKALKIIAESLPAVESKKDAISLRSHEESDELKRQHDSRMAKMFALEDELEKKIKKLESDLAIKLAESEAIVSTNLSEEIQRLIEKHTTANSEFLSLSKQLEEVTVRLHVAQSIEALREEFNRLDRNKHDLERSIQAIAEQLRTHTFPTDLAQHFTLAKILKEGSYNPDVPEENKYTAPLYATSTPTLGADLVSAINHKFNETPGKAMSDFEMTNLLICTQQNLITMLHGKPGAGKTSTAIRLGQALGILSNDNDLCDNFLNIGVSRGWSSSRDFIGFFNSLKGLYQPSRTGMYRFLISSKDISCSNAFRIVLLDEANLSQIEYYWSDYISMCDAEGLSKSIDLGLPSKAGLIAPNGLNSGAMRFIATLNNDDTTEPLSPRLIDRAAIINLDVNSTYTDFAGRYELDGAVSKSMMDDFFGVNNTDSSTFKDAEDYSLIKMFIEKATDTSEKFGDPLSISYRKRIAIRNYLSSAVKIMSSEVIAQDFAISQFLLPVIKGESSHFKSRLDELLALASRYELSRSEELLKRIITEGESYLHSYSFV